MIEMSFFYRNSKSHNENIVQNRIIYQNKAYMKFNLYGIWYFQIFAILLLMKEFFNIGLKVRPNIHIMPKYSFPFLRKFNKCLNRSTNSLFLSQPNLILCPALQQRSKGKFLLKTFFYLGIKFIQYIHKHIRVGRDKNTYIISSTLSHIYFMDSDTLTLYTFIY